MDGEAEKALIALVEVELRAIQIEIHQQGIGGLTAAKLRLESALEFNELTNDVAVEALTDLDESARRLRAIMTRIEAGIPPATIEEALVRLGLSSERLPDVPLPIADAVAFVAERLSESDGAE